MRVSWDDTAMSRRDRLALAEQSALKAVAMDDSSGEAHATLSLVRKFNYQFTSAERELKEAVMLEPANPQFRVWLVQLYVLTERPAEALVEARHALALDPLSAAANGEFARALLANDQCEEALAELKKLRSVRPPLLRASGIAAQCYARRQMWPEAIAEMQRDSVNGGLNSQALLGYLLGRAGRTTEARRMLEAMLDRSRKTNGSAFNVGLVYAGLGEKDQAFSWLNKALAERSIFLEYMPTVLSGLAGDPRLGSFRARLGLEPVAQRQL
jgi:tetratricopeptide (TPR) repeat protein